MRFHGRQLGIVEWRRLIRRQLDMHELSRHGLAQAGKHLLEQGEAFALVLVQGIALAIAAQADNLAQMLKRHEMLAS